MDARELVYHYFSISIFTQTILFLAWLNFNVRSQLSTVSTAMERRRIGAGAGPSFGSLATSRRASGPVRPRSVVTINWAIDEVALSALHRLPKPRAIKPSTGWRGISASSTSNHKTGTTGMRAG